MEVWLADLMKDVVPRLDIDAAEYRRLGFNMLTGEADQLGFRYLVDLDVPAADSVRNYFGGTVDVVADNWNSGSEKSILVDRDTLRKIVFYHILRVSAIIVLFEDGVRSDPRLSYATDADEAERLADNLENLRQYSKRRNLPFHILLYKDSDWFRGAPHGRNMHEMSGRIV